MSFVREYAKSSKNNDQNENAAENIHEDRNPTIENEGNNFIFYICLGTNFVRTLKCCDSS